MDTVRWAINFGFRSLEIGPKGSGRQVGFEFRGREAFTDQRVSKLRQGTDAIGSFDDSIDEETAKRIGGKRVNFGTVKG